MKLSRRVARFNKLINNRIQRVYAWFLPPWAVILHRGRHTGRSYRTPVLAFRQHNQLIIALLYGTETEWLQNLHSSGGHVVRRGNIFELTGRPNVIATNSAAQLARLSAPARAYCQLADHQAVLDLGTRQRGFGPHRTPARQR